MLRPARSLQRAPFARRDGGNAERRRASQFAATVGWAVMVICCASAWQVNSSDALGKLVAGRIADGDCETGRLSVFVGHGQHELAGTILAQEIL